MVALLRTSAAAAISTIARAGRSWLSSSGVVRGRAKEQGIQRFTIRHRLVRRGSDQAITESVVNIVHSFHNGLILGDDAIMSNLIMNIRKMLGEKDSLSILPFKLHYIRRDATGAGDRLKRKVPRCEIVTESHHFHCHRFPDADDGVDVAV